jgi:hypothetical protein
MTYEEAADKFRGCAEYAHWPKAKTEGVIGLIAGLENVADMRKLTPFLRAPG